MVPTDASPTNPGLLAAMKRANESPDPDALAQLMDELQRSAPIVALRRDENGGEELIALKAEGSVVIPAFTDLDALLRWDSEARDWAAMTGPALCGMALERGVTRVVLNPGGPYAGSLGEPDLGLIADSAALEGSGQGSGVLRVTHPDALQLEAVREPPPDLGRRLRAALTRSTGVSSAHLLLASYPERKQWLLALELAPDVDTNAAIESLAASLGQELTSNQSVDLMVADPALQTELSEFEPIWRAEAG